VSPARPFLVILLFLAALCPACGREWATPLEIAERFWEAVRTGDLETARAFATAASADHVDAFQEGSPVSDVMFGESLQNESSAIVRTSLLTERGEIELRVLFNTRLRLEETGWRVDVDETQDEMGRAVFAAGIEHFGEVVGETAEELGTALEEGMQDLNEAIREALEGAEAQPQE
jgi:hypothetical protein